MDKEKMATILGALLREIGTFIQRADMEELRSDLSSYIKDFPSKHDLSSHTAYFGFVLEKLLPEAGRGPITRILLDACRYDPDPAKQGIYPFAECLAAGLGSEEEVQQHHPGPNLQCIFDGIETSFAVRKPGETFLPLWHYPLSKLDLRKALADLQADEGIFPLHVNRLNGAESTKAAVDQTKRYRDLLEGFLEEFLELNPFFAWDSRAYFNELFYLMQKYTWSIPARPGVSADISLFDRMKTTAAIVACLTDQRRERPSDQNGFLLWGADLSGIQPFIFRITRGLGVGGISKRLRGRSLYLMMLMEVLARHLLEECGLPLANLNFCGGGNLELLLPCTNHVMDILEKFQQEGDDWIEASFSGQLALVMAAVPMSAEELQKDFAAKRTLLQDQLATNKRQKFSRSFKKNGFWVKASAPSYHPVTICPSCNLNMVIPRTEPEVCSDCLSHKKVGHELPQTKYLVFASERLPGKAYDSSAYCDFGRFGCVHLRKDADVNLYFTDERCREIVSVDPDAGAVKGFLYLSNVLPTAKKSLVLETEKDSDGEQDEEGCVSPDQTLSFTTLANMAKGDKRIGILKMDVDNLGSVFSVGLDPQGSPESIHARSRSLSRTSVLSREMNYFFNGIVALACEEVSGKWQRGDEKSDWGERVGYSNDDVSGIFYVVFSGGDDLFIVGPWDRIIELAGLLRQLFKDFTCHNPNLSISAGVFVCKPKYPISLAARKAEEALERAKEKGRNRITLFEETAVWADEEPEKSRVFQESVADLSGKFFEHCEIRTDEIFMVDRPQSTRINTVPFSRLSSLEKVFLNLCESQAMPRSFVHRLLQSKHKFLTLRYDLEQQREEEDFNLMIFPHLFYLMQRNLKQEAFMAIRSELFNSGDAISLLRQIKIPATMFLLKTTRS